MISCELLLLFTEIQNLRKTSKIQNLKLGLYRRKRNRSGMRNPVTVTTESKVRVLGVREAAAKKSQVGEDWVLTLLSVASSSDSAAP